MVVYSNIIFVNTVSAGFNLLAILLPWLTFSANTPSQRMGMQILPATKNTGSMYLYQTLGCSEYVDDIASNVARGACSLITTGNLPQMLGYMKNAMNVGLAFTILSFLANLVSFVIVYYKVSDKLDALLGEQSFQKGRYAIVTTNSMILVFNCIAFGSFSGLINMNFNVNSDGFLIGFGGLQDRTWVYGAGFGFSIVVAILSGCIVGAELLHKRDAEKQTHVANPMIATPT